MPIYDNLIQVPANGLLFSRLQLCKTGKRILLAPGNNYSELAPTSALFSCAHYLPFYLTLMQFIKHLVLSCVTVGAFACTTSACAADTPTSLKGVEVVDAGKAKALMASGAKMIDTRVSNEFAEGHIVGAVNVPYKEKSAKAADFDSAADTFDLSKLPADKSQAIITQCNGPECWKSYKGATAAIKAGYKKVYWMRGGFPEWKARGYPVE